MSAYKRIYASSLLLILLVCFCSSFINEVAASSDQQSRNLFSHPFESLEEDAKLDFMLGRSLFRRQWVTAPASTQAADGLGPLYNARSCTACHQNNARGRGPLSQENNVGDLIVRIDIPPQRGLHQLQLADRLKNNVPEPNYGLQMQSFAIPGYLAEYQLEVEYEIFTVVLADGTSVHLQKPLYKISELGYGPLHDEVRTSPRVPPQMIGLGLLEAIKEQDILKQEDPYDKDEDGISGRANIVWSNETSTTKLGRFGYKAGTPSINEQVQSAFSIDLGLSVPLFTNPAGDCTDKQEKCLSAPNGNSIQYDNLEVNQQIVDLVNLYVRNIVVPARRNSDDPAVLSGEKVFNQIGCQKCHAPNYTMSDNKHINISRGQKIFPYTDLLLHDMGEGLADNRPEGKATGTEWRTAPLWGIGLTKQVAGYAHFLHDGRAHSLMEAILWHGGEAKLQRDEVTKLDSNSREQLIVFLESL